MKNFQEQRQKIEYKFLVLQLANVRGGIDKLTAVCAFTTEEKLYNFIESQKEEWTDDPSPDQYGNVHGYSKSFKKGSILEWYNAPSTLAAPNSYGGVWEYWTDKRSGFTIPIDPT